MLIYRLQLAGPITSIGTDFRNANHKTTKLDTMTQTTTLQEQLCCQYISRIHSQVKCSSKTESIVCPVSTMTLTPRSKEVYDTMSLGMFKS